MSDRKFRVISGGDDPPPQDPDDPGPRDEDAPKAPRAVSPEEAAETDRRCTEIANSDVFYRAHGVDLRYCYERAAWLAWTGSRWSWEVALQEVERRSTLTARNELNDALVLPTTPKALKAWVKRSCSLSSRRSMADGCRYQLGVAIDDLDADPMIVNAPNGTITLRTGLVLNQQRSDYLTHQTAVDADLEAPCPRWLDFVSEIFGGSDDLVEYVQRAIGYSLTARMDAQQMFACVGTGSNGKSVMLSTIRRILGDYAKTISASLLTVTTRNKFPEIADLLGVRFAVATEPDSRSQLDEALIKAITGGDELVGERKYEAPFTFRPVCKVWLACNQIPSFQSGGYSMERRLVVIPFRETFEGDRDDPRLADKLLAEGPGILKWAIDGCALWRESGLVRPREIVAAIEEARGDTDPLYYWWEERVVVLTKNARTPVTSLYADYKKWCEGVGQKPMGLPRFRTMVRSRGVEVVTINKRLYLVGVGLVDDDNRDETENENLFG